MTEFFYVLKNKEGRYQANRFHHMSWTCSLTRAQTYPTRDEAVAAMAVLGGQVALVAIAEVDLSTMVEVEVDEAHTTH